LDLKQHTFLTFPLRALHPHCSTDGKYIVYTAPRLTQRAQIFVRDTEKGVPTQLTFVRANNLYPKLSPNGQYVAFASDKEGDWNVYIINRKNPASWRQVSMGRQDDIAPSWSPDGKRLAYCSKTSQGVWELVIADLVTGALTILGPGMYPEWSPHKEPDKQLIAFQTQKVSHEREAKIMVIKPDGSNVKEVTLETALELPDPVPKWSPDGEWIVFAGVKKGWPGQNIWLIKPDGTQLTRLTQELQPDILPTWGGDRIFFVAERKGALNIYSVQPYPLKLLEDER
jgi:TolB protein